MIHQPHAEITGQQALQFYAATMDVLALPYERGVRRALDETTYGRTFMVGSLAVFVARHGEEPDEDGTLYRSLYIHPDWPDHEIHTAHLLVKHPEEVVDATTLIKRQQYSADELGIEKSYHESTEIIQRDKTHRRVVADANDVLYAMMQQAETEEALGVNTFTVEKLNEAFAFLKQCTPYNEVNAY